MKMLRIRRTALSFAAAIKLPCSAASPRPSPVRLATAAAVYMCIMQISNSVLASSS